MGGSFNPITMGHLELAELVLCKTDLEEVWVVPCYGHLKKTEMVISKHRLKMCEIATADLSGVRVFDYEIKNELEGSTYDFLKKLFDDEDYQDYEFSYIIGEDNVWSFNDWRNSEELKELVRFITVPRHGWSRKNQRGWHHEFPHIYLSEEVRNICSTSIRGWLKLWWEGEWKKWAEDKLENEIHPEVFEYIKEYELYKGHEEV